MRILTYLGLAAALLVAAPSRAVVLTFDDLAGDHVPVPNGYGGLDWDNMWILDAIIYPGSNGYFAGMVSPSNVAFNAFGNPAAASGTPFDFNGVYLTAAWYDGLQITVEGFIGANPVAAYTQTVLPSATAPTWFQFDYLGVNMVKFTSFGGTPHPGYDGDGTHFAMDNFTFNQQPPGTGAIPEPGTLALLGFGGLAVLRRRRRR